MKVFSSWSGGKECALATYKAISEGYEVFYLLNFISEDGKRSRSHGVSREVLNLQSKAIGIPIIQVETSWESYEENFKLIVGKLKGEGIEGGVFGDMDLEEHKKWIERVCDETGIKPILPLWGIESEKLFDEFFGKGFEAEVIATKLGENLLGRKLDKAFLSEVQNLGSHPCGENGEYHTFVTSGPIFKKALEISQGKEEKRDNTWFLEISAKS